ncbi:hypothetical protein [Blastococcus aurantiacus]|uniref:hypothetical protein n=1 Tax=Blastococcus aurantiacus TaxID=1550231 RepID=UPI0015A2B01C|nr:hypothetical protein [Blastococcus aurantiacus]
MWHRSLWIGATGFTVAALAVISGMAASPSYTATSSLYVGVSEVDAGQGLAWSSLLDDELLPSIVRLGTSPAVLGPVAEELPVDRTPAELAADVDIAPVPDTSVLVVTARAASASGAADLADAVAESLSTVATAAHADADGGSYLRADVVGPAREPRFPSGTAARTGAVRGLAVGLLLGVVLSGLLELARPRIRDLATAAALTTSPVLAGLPAAGRGGPRGGRRTGLDRLAWLLRSSPAVPDLRRLVVLGTDARVARRLADDLGQVPGTGLAPVPMSAAGLRDVRPAEHDGLLVVATGRTTHRSLTAAVAAAEASGIPVLGVVLDGILPPAARWRDRLLAAVRGNAPLPRRVSAAPGAVDGLRPPWLTSSRIAAAGALFAVGLAMPTPGSTTTAFVAGLVLLPLWIAAVPRFRGAGLLCGLAVLALVSGALLAGWSAVERDFSVRAATEIPVLLLTGLGAVGLVLWARGVLPVPAIGVAYGLGLLVHGLLRADQSINAFKFELSLPLTIVVLSLAGMRQGRAAAVVALAGLGIANVANDARSAFGFCVIAAGLVLWQLRPVARAGRSNAWAGILLLGATAVGVYLAATELMIAGALGEEVQTRTTTQIEQSGSLLLGGRPEWTATWALMQDRPLGYGLGIVPDSHDLDVARAGLAVTRIPTVEGYLENFMLTDRFELHSVAADLWSALGPAGLAYGVALAALLVGSLSQLLARRQASGLVCFLGLTAIWNVAFGTLPSNGVEVSFAVGLMLLARTTVPSRAAEPAGTAPVPAVPAEVLR